MSVYKHQGSAFWRFDFQLDRRRFYGTTDVPKDRPQREAQAYEKAERRKAEQLVEAAQRENRAPLTLERACERWWDEVGQHGAETDLKNALDWLCEAIGGKRPLHTIRGDDVARAVAERRKCVVRAKRDHKGVQLYRPVSARTVNRTVPLLLRRVLNRARDSWNAVVSSMPDWKEHLVPEKKRHIREITIEEQDKLDETDRDDYRAIRQFAILTGLRLNEILLTWMQVDFDAGVVRIVAKGDEPHTVPLSKTIYALLWAERGRHPEYVFTFVAKRTRTCPHTGQRYERGQRYPITYFGLTSHRRRHWPTAGVKARWHDLRHTAGMRTLRATGNLEVTRKQLGHSDVSTTARFYAKALVDDVRDAMERTERDQQSRRKSRTARENISKPMKGNE
jgi:integrase